MAKKRKQPHHDSSTGGYTSKRSWKNHSSNQQDASQGYLDYTTGMRGALPGLDDIDEFDAGQTGNTDEDEIVRTEKEAMKYLRDVR